MQKDSCWPQCRGFHSQAHPAVPHEQWQREINVQMGLVLVSCFWCKSPRLVFLLQVIGHTPRNENLPQVGSMAPSPASSGTPASFQGPPSMMDTETEEYMDYTGCSPGGISSESSNMDRSCSSTPVGNESTSAGKG